MGGHCIDHYGLPVPTQDKRPNMAYVRETAYDRNEMENTVSTCEPTLTPEQDSIYRQILQAVQNATPEVFFLDSPGGSGKTHLLRLLLAKVRTLNPIKHFSSLRKIWITNFTSPNYNRSDWMVILHWPLPPRESLPLYFQEAKRLIPYSKSQSMFIYLTLPYVTFRNSRIRPRLVFSITYSSKYYSIDPVISHY